jgi:alpha-galactosidase
MGKGKTIWLDTIDLSEMTCGWGVPLPRKTVLERPLTLRCAVHEHGIGTHADSEFVVLLNGTAVRFDAVVGVDDEVPETGASRFQVLLDGKIVADSGSLTSKDPPHRISADLRGGKELKLIVRDEENETHWAHADWCDACIELAEGETMPLLPVKTMRPSAPAVVVRSDTAVPRINHPRITGATPGKPFLFRIPASGAGPLSFTAEGLPNGLSLDTRTGIINGSLRSEGESRVQVTVRGPAGSCSEDIVIAGGRRKLALTPPMGWNSWNVWGVAVDQDKVKAAADALVSTGLAAHGFQYVNIDDGWEAGRAADETILTNEKFPDMKGLADYIHSKGLKFGIYSSPGPKTCGGYTGSYQHEEQDARTYAAWGVDYLKYDWCSYEGIAADKSLEERQKPYRVMAAALDKCDRDIVYSLCQYGMGRVWEWGRDVGGNLWRTTGDITDAWGSMYNIGFRQAPHHGFAGPGGWNDPDMLVLGWVGWGPRLHETHLSRHEQITHMSLWCLLSAPLLIGCDLTKLDDWTLSLLANEEVTALDQDPLGKQAQRVSRENNTQKWVKPLSDGGKAVGLFNLNQGSLNMTVNWEEIGVSGPQRIRDLWQHRDLGTFSESFAAEVASRGAVLVKLMPAG